MNFKNLKKKIYDHREEIVIAGMFATFVALSLVAMKAALNQQAEVQAALEGAINRGDTILPNGDGSFWIISTQ